MRVWFSLRAFALGSLLASACASAVGCGSSSTSDDGGAGTANAGSGASGASAGSSAAGGSSAGFAGGAGSGGGGGADVASACAAYANARCARYHECVPFSFGVTYASLADCETSTEQYCPFELAAPGSSRTATVLSACTAGTLTQTCGEWLTALPADCRVPGANATGSACEYDSQCSSTYCQRRDRGWCGNCAPRTQLGAQCSPRESACATGLKCARSCADPADCPKIEANYHCIAPKSENEACPIGTECRNDLYCVNGRCGQGLALGAACEIGLCVGELQCLSDPNGNTCRVSSYAAVGVACNLAEGHYCSANATCSDAGGQPLNGGQGTCKAAAAPGQACPNGCAAPAQCSAASVCVLPVAAATCQ